MTSPERSLPGTPAAPRAVPVSFRSGLVLVLASVVGLGAFCWPLLAPPGSVSGRVVDAPLLFLLMVPILVVVLLAELSGGGIDARALAMLGVLAAVNAVLRPLGAGTAGIEPMFFLLVLAGRVFGPGFGFLLGSISLFASALLTAGVGPWLPYQMLAAGWVGLGAGLLPGAARLRGWPERLLLAGYGAFAAYLFGALMNMSFWPYAIGLDTPLSFVPGAPVLDNLHRFLVFTVATSAVGWDTARAVTTAAGVLVLGPAVLVTLRRAARKAAFTTPPEFTDRRPRPPNPS